MTEEKKDDYVNITLRLPQQTTLAMSNLAGVAGVPVEHAIQLLLVLGLPPAPKRREEPPRGKPAAWMGSTGSPVVEGPDPPTGTDIDWVPLYV